MSLGFVDTKSDNPAFVDDIAAAALHVKIMIYL